MKPWTKFWPPTGPSSPAQNIPATAPPRHLFVDEPGVVVGLAEQVAAAAVAREHQRRPSALAGEQEAQVLVGAVGVADLELDGRPDLGDGADGEVPGLRVGAEHVADQEVAAPEGVLLLVDHLAHVEPVLDQLAVVRREGGDDLAQPVEARGARPGRGSRSRWPG